MEIYYRACDRYYFTDQGNKMTRWHFDTWNFHNPRDQATPLTECLEEDSKEEVAILREEVFPGEVGLYVKRDIPSYGFFRAVRIPAEAEEDYSFGA